MLVMNLISLLFSCLGGVIDISVAAKKKQHESSYPIMVRTCLREVIWFCLFLSDLLFAAACTVVLLKENASF